MTLNYTNMLSNFSYEYLKKFKNIKKPTKSKNKKPSQKLKMLDLDEGAKDAQPKEMI